MSLARYAYAQIASCAMLSAPTTKAYSATDQKSAGHPASSEVGNGTNVTRKSSTRLRRMRVPFHRSITRNLRWCAIQFSPMIKNDSA